MGKKREKDMMLQKDEVTGKPTSDVFAFLDSSSPIQQASPELQFSRFRRQGHGNLPADESDHESPIRSHYSDSGISLNDSLTEFCQPASFRPAQLAPLSENAVLTRGVHTETNQQVGPSDPPHSYSTGTDFDSIIHRRHSDDSVSLRFMSLYFDPKMIFIQDLSIFNSLSHVRHYLYTFIFSPLIRYVITDLLNLGSLATRVPNLENSACQDMTCWLPNFTKPIKFMAFH